MKCNHDALIYTYTDKTYYIRFILWYKSCWFISCFSITWIFSCLYLISSVYPKKEYCNWNTAQKSGRKEVGKQKIGLCLWCKTYLYRIHKRDIDERHFCVSSLKRPLVSYKTIIVSIEEITSWMKKIILKISNCISNCSICSTGWTHLAYKPLINFLQTNYRNLNHIHYECICKYKMSEIIYYESYMQIEQVNVQKVNNISVIIFDNTS